MPIFRSIGVHRGLRTRLATKSNATTLVEELDSNVKQQQQQQQQYQIIDTPHALLSRNPTTLNILSRPLTTTTTTTNTNDIYDVENESAVESDLVISKPISHQHALKLRQDVSDAVVRQSRNGKRIGNIRNTLNTSLKRRRRYVSNDGKANAASDPDDHQMSHIMLHCAPSILEMLNFRQIASKENIHENNIPYRSYPFLSTGCKELDELIALPPEHKYASNQLEIMDDQNSGTGLPFGYVLQLCGPPSTGKTQIALQLACSPGLYQTWYLSSSPAIHTYATRLNQLVLESRATRDKSVSETLSFLDNHSQNVLERTIFTVVNNEYDVLSELSRLESFLADQATSNPVLLVIDSCSGCMSSMSDSLILTVAHAIKRITRMYGLATVLINGTVGEVVLRQTPPADNEKGVEQRLTAKNVCAFAHRRGIKPALGKPWWNISADIHLWIDWLTEGKNICAVLERHTAKVSVVFVEPEVTDDIKELFQHRVAFRLSSSGVMGLSPFVV